MIIHQYKKNNCKFAIFNGRISFSSDISDLKDIINEAIADGAQRVAIRFPEESLLGPEAIGSIVSSAHLLDEAGKKFVLIAPTDQILSVIRDFKMEPYITIADSESSACNSSA